MTEAERLHRAQEAQRLIDEPMLTESLLQMFSDAQKRMMFLEPDAHEKRWLAACEMRVIQGFRDRLKAAVLDGTDLARARPKLP